MQNNDFRNVRGYQTIILSLLFLAGVVAFLDRVSLSVANTIVRAELNFNSHRNRLAALRSFPELRPISDPMGRHLAARQHVCWVLGGGLAIWSAAQFLTGFVRNLPTFLALRVLLGVGESPFYPAGVKSVRQWFPSSQRGRAMATMTMSQIIGLASAPPLLTWVMLRAGGRPHRHRSPRTNAHLYPEAITRLRHGRCVPTRHRASDLEVLERHHQGRSWR